MKKYKLTLKCSNCDYSWKQEIPFGKEWQNFSSFGFETKAGYGKPCWNGRHLDCRETKFHQVTCKTCGSEDVYFDRV